MKTIKWGEPLSLEEMEALRDGESFTVLSWGRPVCRISMDSFEVIREHELEEQCT